MSRLSPPSLGSEIKIQAGTIAFGNDKNLWIRKKRNDKNTYWTTLAEVKQTFLIGSYRNETFYEYVECKFDLPNDEHLFITYFNNGRIRFEYFSPSGDNLDLVVPLNPIVPKGFTNERIRTFREIVIDFIEYKLNEDDKYFDLFLEIKLEINVFVDVLANQIDAISEAWTDKSKFDYQARITSKKFKADRDALSILNIFEDDEEKPQPTPQPDDFKPIWRVKTEQEFIDEFGENWKTQIKWNVTGNMDYLFGKPVTNPNFDGENITFQIFDTAEELGIDSGKYNKWSLDSDMFTKIENDEQESSPMIGKLLTKEGNLDTYLKISEDVDRLELNSDEFVFIKPAKFNDSKIFKFLSTDKAREQYDTICKIRLDYKLGISIDFQIESRDIDYYLANITSESTFFHAISYVKKFLLSGQFEQELDAIALLLRQGIWRERSIVCDFMSSIPYPKFQVGDRVKKVGGSSVLTIKTITTFDDTKQEWDYDLFNEGGAEVSLYESELELVSQDSKEKPLPSDCKVDENMIDSLVVGAFFQKNKSRINALNSEISCIIKEALLSLSNYEKCGDGAEIPMPQPTQEKKVDLLAEIRDLNKDL